MTVDSEDLDVMEPSRRHEISFSKEALQDILDDHKDEVKTTLKEILHDLDKRLPPPATAASNWKPYTQMPSFLGQFMGRSSGSQNLQVAFEQLLQYNKQLQQENQSLQDKLHAAQQRMTSLTSQLNVASNDLRLGRANNEELKRRMVRLREMLVPPSEDQVTDAEVTRTFLSLRSLVFRFVKGTWAKRFHTHVAEEDLPKGQRAFFSSFLTTGADWKNLHNRLRYLIFFLLNKHVFNRRHYGLEKGFKDLDEYLDQVETFLCNESPPASHGLLVDWRITTMKATEPFRDNQHSLSCATQLIIWDFLSILETNSPEAEEKGKQMLAQICNDAVDLSLMMRKAKDQYFVDMMPMAEGTFISDHENSIDEEAHEVPGSKENVPQSIAYIIAGALVKCPKENLQEIKVLEKAQAVVYK